jgi:hypothetical protein
VGQREVTCRSTSPCLDVDWRGATNTSLVSNAHGAMLACTSSVSDSNFSPYCHTSILPRANQLLFRESSRAALSPVLDKSRNVGVIYVICVKQRPCSGSLAANPTVTKILDKDPLL